MTNATKKKRGSICLIGAGPGDPGLITVKGLARLKRAEVVVHDALVASAILGGAPPGAELIDASKRGGNHKLSQDQINALLVEKAQAGFYVVRLKGGDPYLFGRGAEEAIYAAQHGIACEVIPGITAGIAAPAMAGIPVTHRQVSSTLTLVTGHEDPTKTETAIDYGALARMVAAGGTVCFYMGASRLEAISQALRAGGLAPTTPVGVVQWGTTPRQKSVRTTLDQAARDTAAAGIGAPAIIVVGGVAGIAAAGLDYFVQRPLFGARILVTRTRQQASELRLKLEDLGALVFEAPTIALVAPPEGALARVDDALRNLKQFDWLVLTSVNGVEALTRRLEKLGGDARWLAGVRVAAIGRPTAAALREQLGIAADLVPTQFVAESLAAELIAHQDIKGKRFLLLRADIARPALPQLLAAAGAVVTDLAVYETRLVSGLPDSVLAALRCNEVDWVTFTSASTARNLVQLLGPEKTLLERVKVASIGPVTSEAARTLGLPVSIEAAESTIDGLVAALSAAAKK